MRSVAATAPPMAHVWRNAEGTLDNRVLIMPVSFGSRHALRLMHTLRMAIPHANPGQTIDVRPLGARLAQAKTVALFKSEHLEVMRVVLMAGKSLPPHSVLGEITVQCIEGKIDVTADGQSHVLQAGQLLYLPGGRTHAITAVEDASALVTVALRNER